MTPSNSTAIASGTRNIAPDKKKKKKKSTTAAPGGATTTTTAPPSVLTTTTTTTTTKTPSPATMTSGGASLETKTSSVAVMAPLNNNNNNNNKGRVEREQIRNFLLDLEQKSLERALPRAIHLFQLQQEQQQWHKQQQQQDNDRSSVLRDYLETEKAAASAVRIAPLDDSIRVACACPHLQEWLPHDLTLNFFKVLNTTPSVPPQQQSQSQPPSNNDNNSSKNKVKGKGGTGKGKNSNSPKQSRSSPTKSTQVSAKKGNKTGATAGSESNASKAGTKAGSGGGGTSAKTSAAAKKKAAAAAAKDAAAAATRAALTTTNTTTNTVAKPTSSFLLANPVHALHLQSQWDDPARPGVFASSSTTTTSSAGVGTTSTTIGTTFFRDNAAGTPSTTTSNNRAPPPSSTKASSTKAAANKISWNKSGGGGGNNASFPFSLSSSSPAVSEMQEPAPVLYGDEQERLLAVKTVGLAESWHPWLDLSSLSLSNTTRASSPPPTTAGLDHSYPYSYPYSSAVTSSTNKKKQPKTGSPARGQKANTVESTTPSHSSSVFHPVPPSGSAASPGWNATSSTNNTNDEKQKSTAPMSPISGTTTSAGGVSSTTSNNKTNFPTSPSSATTATTSSLLPKPFGATRTLSTSSAGKETGGSGGAAAAAAATSNPSEHASSNNNNSHNTPMLSTQSFQRPPPPPPPSEVSTLPSYRFAALQSQEEEVRLLRRAFLSKRASTSATPTSAASAGSVPQPPGNIPSISSSAAMAAASSSSGAMSSSFGSNTKKRPHADSAASGGINNNNNTNNVSSPSINNQTKNIKPTTTTSGAASKKRKSTTATGTTTSNANSLTGTATASAVMGSSGAAGSLSKPSLLLALTQQFKQALVVKTLTLEEEETYRLAMKDVGLKVELWMEHYRLARQQYWKETTQSLLMHHPQTQQSPSVNHLARGSFQIPKSPDAVFGALSDAPEVQVGHRYCQLCHSNDSNTDAFWLFNQPRRKSKSKTKTRNPLTQQTQCHVTGDGLMQCLECSFTACGPRSMAPLPMSSSLSSSSKQHMFQHFLMSNHKFAVTCGPQASVYCFRCGDFVYHEVFEQEKERVDLAERLPWMAWKPHPVQRSFDAFQFMKVQDQGIFWRGMVATYPVLVPEEHLAAVRQSRLRQIIFQGEINSLPPGVSRGATDFAVFQARATLPHRWKIRAPVGMYNLGNTCFQSAILQCVMHCTPIQKYFLHEVGHHHLSCQLYRRARAKSLARAVDTDNGLSQKSAGSSINGDKTHDEGVCLACEMDKLMVKYFGSTIGKDIASVLSDHCPGHQRKITLPARDQTNADFVAVRGEPLVTADMLAAAWKCGGMNYLAGYDQRDAHEFLHGFLEVLGKHTEQYRELLHKAIDTARPNNSVVPFSATSQHDAIKSFFEGTLRSVLVCQDCGSKRTKSESFMSISLPLSKEVQRATSELPGESVDSPQGRPLRVKVSVERCLRHFTLPEMLADPVDCLSCGKKTSTKKQHVVSKLPRVLCLHLKRFDAALNKKIEDFVAFPKLLNMGPFLPHWCEVERVPSADGGMQDTAQITYDLFGTVNHFGNLQSGHYIANVKIQSKWYHCNDAHVSEIKEADVLKGDAYLLFYIRKEMF